MAAVEDDIRSRSDELVDFLGELVEQQTVTGNEKPGQEVVAEKFRSMDLDPDVWEPDPDNLKGHEAYFETTTFLEQGYEDRPNVAAKLEGVGDGPTLTLSGHIDVVSVDEEEWEREPWTLTQEGDKLFGRGAADMKGGIAAYVAAIETLQKLGVQLEGDVILQSTIEEEDGGVGGVLSALERGYQPDAAIVPEPWEVPNIGIAGAGVMYFEISLKGKSAHAAWGHEGVSAFRKTIPIFQALDQLDKERKERIDYEPAYRTNPSLKDNETNINLGVVEAGDWPSTVASQATIKGRVGWPPGESRAEVREQIESTIEEVAENDEWLSEHPPTIEWIGWQAAPHEVPEDAEIVQISKRNAEAVTGEEGEFVGGNAGLDERFFKLYYDIDVATVGPEGNYLHGADEYTTLSSLIDTSATIARSIVDYCGVAEE